MLRPALLLFALSTAAYSQPSIAYSIRTLDSVAVTVGAGQPATLVTVFATWCSTCRAEFATIDSLHRALAPRGVRVLALSVDERDDAHVRRFVEARKATVPTARDRSGAVGRTFGAVGVPEHYLVDGSGRVRWHGRGDIRASMRALKHALAKLAQGTSGAMAAPSQ